MAYRAHRYENVPPATAKPLPTLAYVGIMSLVWMPLVWLLVQAFFP